MIKSPRTLLVSHQPPGLSELLATKGVLMLNHWRDQGCGVGAGVGIARSHCNEPGVGPGVGVNQTASTPIPERFV